MKRQVDWPCVWLACLLGLASPTHATTHINDPSGDVCDPCVEYPPAVDIVRLSGGYTTSNVVFILQFRADSLGAGGLSFALYLDTNQTDERRGAGRPGGTDYQVYGPVGGTAGVRHVDDAHTELGRVPVIPWGPAALRVDIPLSLLGNDDGVMDFGAVAGEEALDMPQLHVMVDGAPDAIYWSTSGLPDGAVGDLTVATTPLDPLPGPLPDARLWTEVSGGWEFTDGVWGPATADPTVGPSTILNPQLNDLARARLEYDGLDRILGNEAKASLSGGLGVRTHSYVVLLAPDLNHVQTRAVAGHERKWRATWTDPGPPPATIDIDVLLFLEGKVAIVDLNAPEARLFDIPWPAALWSEVKFDVTAATLIGLPVTVWSSSARLAPQSNQTDFELTVVGPPSWQDAWSGPQRDPAMPGVRHALDYQEVHNSAFTVPLGEQFVVQMTLEVASFNDRTAGLFDAVADFFSTAGLAVSTQRAGVVLEEIIADSTLELIAIRVQDGQVELTWESYPGRRYAIERAASPLGAWEVVRRDLEAAPDPNNRTTLSLAAAAEAGTAEYFRVVEQP